MIPTWYIQIQTLNNDNIAIITRYVVLVILVIGPRLGQAQGPCFFGRPWAVFWRLWDCTATITALSLKNWKYIGSERKQSKTRNLPLSISFSKFSSYIYASINNKATLYQHNFFPPKIQNGSRFLIFSRVKIHSFPKKNNSPLLTAIFVCKTIHYHFLKTKKMMSKKSPI